MNLIFGELYILNAKRYCDNCGSPQVLTNVPGVFMGTYPSGDLFSIAPFGCPGCHKTVDRYNYRQPINVTEEIKENYSNK